MPSTAASPPPTLYLIPSFSLSGGGTPPSHDSLAKLMDKTAEKTQNGHDSFNTPNNNVMRNTEKTPMVVDKAVNASRLFSSSLSAVVPNTKGPSAKLATHV
mmetsp:Transcript_4569/g.8676  ORF Transcript_4569/g.8676 Transcript_4569/m.8676 type:complete len:101 (+) Transcript_4569:562-864(+)